MCPACWSMISNVTSLSDGCFLTHCMCFCSQFHSCCTLHFGWWGFQWFPLTQTLSPPQSFALHHPCLFIFHGFLCLVFCTAQLSLHILISFLCLFGSFCIPLFSLVEAPFVTLSAISTRLLCTCSWLAASINGSMGVLSGAARIAQGAGTVERGHGRWAYLRPVSHLLKSYSHIEETGENPRNTDETLSCTNKNELLFKADFSRFRSVGIYSMLSPGIADFTFPTTEFQSKLRFQGWDMFRLCSDSGIIYAQMAQGFHVRMQILIKLFSFPHWGVKEQIWIFRNLAGSHWSSMSRPQHSF